MKSYRLDLGYFPSFPPHLATLMLPSHHHPLARRAPEGGTSEGPEGGARGWWGKQTKRDKAPDETSYTAVYHLFTLTRLLVLSHIRSIRSETRGAEEAEWRGEKRTVREWRRGEGKGRVSERKWRRHEWTTRGPSLPSSSLRLSSLILLFSFPPVRRNRGDDERRRRGDEGTEGRGRGE